MTATGTHKCRWSRDCCKPGVLLFEGFKQGQSGGEDIKDWFCQDHAPEFEAQIEALGGFCRLTDAIPEVGMGATTAVGSDCYPYTIVEVSADLKTVVVQQDHHKPAPGCDYFTNQVYIYTPDPEATKDTYTLRNNGRYVLKGESVKSGRRLARLAIGWRRFYQNPSF